MPCSNLPRLLSHQIRIEATKLCFLKVQSAGYINVVRWRNVRNKDGSSGALDAKGILK